MTRKNLSPQRHILLLLCLSLLSGCALIDGLSDAPSNPDSNPDSTPECVFSSQDASVRIPSKTEYQLELNATPLQHVEFDGGQNSGKHLEWSIISRPKDSRTRLTSPTNPNPKLWLDLVGTYIVELNVFDTPTSKSCTNSAVKIHVKPIEEIYIQLSWDPTPDHFTHLDLYYRHLDAKAWVGGGKTVVSWSNPTSDWGTGKASLRSKDPANINPFEESTTEVIAHTNPETGKYQVGVFYGQSLSHEFQEAAPAVNATVRTYFNGILHTSSYEKLMRHKQFWYVSTIYWPDKSIGRVDTLTCEGAPLDCVL